MVTCLSEQLRFALTGGLINILEAYLDEWIVPAPYLISTPTIFRRFLSGFIERKSRYGRSESRNSCYSYLVSLLCILSLMLEKRTILYFKIYQSLRFSSDSC